MNWELSNRFDKEALPLADRHYNRQKIGSNQFVPPGRCIVLLGKQRKALWVSSWPFEEFTHHQWAGAWICSCFRNEGEALSSDLIKEAVAITRGIWVDPPPLGMVTFINTSKVRKKRDWGRCYRKAGFVHCGYTKKNNLFVLRLAPSCFPDAILIPNPQLQLFNAA